MALTHTPQEKYVKHSLTKDTPVMAAIPAGALDAVVPPDTPASRELLAITVAGGVAWGSGWARVSAVQVNLLSHATLKEGTIEQSLRRVMGHGGRTNARGFTPLTLITFTAKRVWHLSGGRTVSTKFMQKRTLQELGLEELIYQPSTD